MRAVLDRISDLLLRWDRLTGRPAYRAVGVAAGALGLVGWLLLTPPAAVPLPAWQVAGVGGLMALWWVGRVLPMWITGLVPVLAFPGLGVQSLGEVGLAYAHPLNLLMLGGLLLGHGVERVGLHHRLVALVLSPAWVRESPRRVIFAMMAVTALLSGILSNTATTLMLLPLALALGRRCTEDPRQRGAFVLALAFAATLGGASTLVGTPPNAVLASLEPRVSFASWMLLGVPFVLGGLPLAHLVVTRVAVPLPAKFESPPIAPPRSGWSGAERGVVGVLLVALALWVTRRSVLLGEGLELPGWERLVPPWLSQDAWVALAAATVLFVLPVPTSTSGRFVLEPRRLARGVPWSVLLLLGGGFALAAAIEGSGLTATLAQSTVAIGAVHGSGGWGPLFALVLIGGLITGLTEVASNTATSQILLPVLAAGAVAAEIDPLLWMVPATLSASCAFMMPVATAPNAIACEAGGVAPADLAWAGLWLNGAALIWAVFLSWWLTPLIYG